MLNTLLVLGGAVIAPEDRLVASVQLSIVGMLVVFSALALIQGMLILLEKMTREAPVPAVEPTPTLASGSGTAVTSDLSPEVVAVIIAAVIAATGPTGRVKQIRLVGLHSGTQWSDHGRHEQLVSHRLRKKDS